MATIDAKTTSEIVASYAAKPEMLVQILQTIVSRYGWIPEATVRQLADELNLSRADVHGVVQYYHDFRTEEPGQHVVKICQAEACQAMGSERLTEHASKTLALGLHEHSKALSLEPIYCLGNCACAPAIMVDGKTHGRVTEDRFDSIIRSLAGDQQ